MTEAPSMIRPGLSSRVRNILLSPSSEWDVVRAEPANTQSLFTGYAMILAAIGPICGLIGGQVFGHSAFGVHWRPDLSAAIAGAVAGYLTALAGVFVLGLVIDFLAPRFGGRQDRVSAMKTAVYSSTAAWLAGVFELVPALSVLSILGLYGLYLLYLGLPRLMDAPKDRALVYTVATVLAGFVVFVVVAWVTGMVTSMFGGGPDMTELNGMNIRIS